MCTAVAYLRSAARLILVVGSIIAVASPALAATSRSDGLFITVGGSDRSIGSQENDRITGIVKRAVDRFRADRTARGSGSAKNSYRIVFDFNPEGKSTSSGDFGACYELARFLLDDLDDDVLTIAFVHGPVTGQAVLPVLACRNLVMSSDATLGDVEPRNDHERSYYRDVLERQHDTALAPSLRLIDAKMRVRRAYLLPNTAIWIDARTLPEKPGILAEVMINGKATQVRLDAKDAVEDPFADGATAFSNRQAVKYGLCQRIAQTRADVAWAYELPPTSLRGDPLLGRTPRPWRIDMEGPVTEARVQSYQRQIKHARGKGANLIILWLRDCGGGDFEPALSFAHYLRELKDDDDVPITTVAYVSSDSPDAATIVALGCSSIVMRRGVTIGDFRSPKFVESDAARNVQRIVGLRDLAAKQGYAESLIDGMMNADVRLVKVEDQQGEQREWRVLTEDEWKKDNRWRLVEEVKPAGKLLTLSADQAHDLNLAQEVLVADDDDLGPLYKYLAIRKEDVQSSKHDWLDKVADFLCSEVVSVLLVMVGIICLILEFKLPGATLPIVIAAVCFVLFFWAHSQLSGQFPWLAVLLFVLGLIFLGLEVFVFPGSAVMGVSGIATILVSLALVTIAHRPESQLEWMEFGRTLTIFGGAILAALGIALFLAAHVHQIPILNRLTLQPGGAHGDLADEDGGAPTHEEMHPAAMLGAIGVSSTPLRPAGKVQFGEEFVDVVAEGGYIGPGTRVQIVEVEGNRVVVKEV